MLSIIKKNSYEIMKAPNELMSKTKVISVFRNVQ